MYKLEKRSSRFQGASPTSSMRVLYLKLFSAETREMKYEFCSSGLFTQSSKTNDFEDIEADKS